MISLSCSLQSSPGAGVKTFIGAGGGGGGGRIRSGAGDAAQKIPLLMTKWRNLLNIKA